GDGAHLPPQRSELLLEEADLVALRLGDHLQPRRVDVAAEAQLDRDRLEGERQRGRRRDAGELVARLRRLPLRVADLALPGPARIAVALVRRPGVAAVAAAPGRGARRGDGVDEAAA